MTKNVKILLIAGVIIVLGLGAFLFKGAEPNSENKISKEEQEFNDSGQAKAILGETDLWKFYENEDAGFSIKYPGDVNFAEEKANGPYSLSVEAKRVGLLEDTMGFNKETAEKNIEFLKKGEYGEDVDWPLAESKKVIKIGEVNAQEFLVLSRFEICDVTFQKKLYFFHNDHQIVITLLGPTDPMVENAHEYFTTNQENCQDQKIWNFEKQGQFYESLKNNSAAPAVQEWFNLFDRIVGTIELSAAPVYDASLLQGKWQSIDDTNSVIEFKDSEKLDYYSDDEMFKGNFDFIADHLTVKDGEEVFEYQIIDLSDDILTMLFLPRGNMLKYSRMK